MKKKLEVYELIFYLWIDVICDEELMKIYNSIDEKLNNELEKIKTNSQNILENKDYYIDKMTVNILNLNFKFNFFNKISSPNSNPEDNEENNDKKDTNLDYFNFRIETDKKKLITI